MTGGDYSNLAWDVRLDREGAVENLVRAYQDRLFGYALRLLKNPHDAQEVVQDALLRAYRHLAFQCDEEWCRNLALTPWLFRITRNLAFNRLRKARGRPANLEDFDGAAASRLSPGQSLPTVEGRVWLEGALARLETGERDLVALRFVEGLSYREIAEVTGGGEASARGKLFRVLKKLRVILDEE